jgi:uncharacterized protein
LIIVIAEALTQFCRRWRVTEMALFGSVRRANIDLLVPFDPGLRRGLAERMEMRSQIQRLLGRDVDLMVRKALERSENVSRCQRILNSAQVIYVA